VKIIKKIYIFLFILYLPVLPSAVAKSNTLLEQFGLVLTSGIDTLTFFNQLAEAEKKYKEKYTQEIVIRCKSCKKLITSGEVFGTIQATGLKEAIDGTSGTFEEVKKILDSYLKLIATQTPAEIQIYTLLVANDYQHSCTKCKGVAWEAHKV